MFFVLLSHLDSSCCQSPRLHVFLRADQWVFSNRRGYHFHKSGLHHQNNSFSEISSKGNSKQQAPNTNKKQIHAATLPNGCCFGASIFIMTKAMHLATKQTKFQLVGESDAEKTPRIKASSSGISSWRTDS